MSSGSSAGIVGSPASSAFSAGDLRVDACVLTAMDDEAAPFLERASSVGPQQRFGNADHRFVSIDGFEILLIRAGIGLINAAGAATEAILRTAPRGGAVGVGAAGAGGAADAAEVAGAGAAGDAGAAGPGPLVISAGSAGGVGLDVSVGEVVVGSSYVNADADVRVFDYALGQSPGMPVSYSAPADVLSALATLAPLPDASGAPIPVRSGLIVSSDTFVSGQLVDGIRSSFPDVLATDMESLGIAQVCHVYGRPFVSIRGISDLADPTAVGDHLTHVDDASDRSARVVLALLAAL